MNMNMTAIPAEDLSLDFFPDLPNVRCFPLSRVMAGKEANFWLADFLVAFRRQPCHCVLDMAGAGIVDAHGFRVLLEAIEQVRGLGYRIVVVEPHASIRRMMERLGLHQEISMFSRLSSALLYLSES